MRRSAYPRTCSGATLPALDRALASGDFDEVMTLYRGDLLEGLHVAGASPDFQDWLDGERGRVRQRAGRPPAPS